jgi:hypothetical protein
MLKLSCSQLLHRTFGTIPYTIPLGPSSRMLYCSFLNVQSVGLNRCELKIDDVLPTLFYLREKETRRKCSQKRKILAEQRKSKFAVTVINTG